MELRYQLGLVTHGGEGLGRDLAVGLSRAGVAVLVADRDLVAAERTAALVRAARVRSWSLQVDLADDTDLRMLAARARDLGGADLLVSFAGAWSVALTRAFLADVGGRRGRRTGSAAVVHVVTTADAGRAVVVEPRPTDGTRVMTLRVSASTPSAAVVRHVVDLLSNGESGAVLELEAHGGIVPATPCPDRRRSPVRKHDQAGPPSDRARWLP